MAVTCGNCGTPVVQSPSTAIEDRIPCPNCGSKARTFVSSVVDAVQIAGTARAMAVTATKAIASLLLQSIVIPGGNVPEGQLIQAVAVPWFDIIEAITRDPEIVHQIPARQWEELVAGAYERAGFDEVILTPRSGDLGRDVIAIKRGLGTVRVIDQVKAFGPGHLVTADDVRALLGVLHADKASKGFLTTTSDFAPRLRDDILLKPYMPAQLGLINGTELISHLDRLARR